MIPSGSGGTTILDRGMWAIRQEAAGHRLKQVLGPNAADLAAVVVSHFDTDHWGGFRQFAKSTKVRLPRLNLYYPAMPRPVRQGLPAMLTLRPGSGVDLQTLGTISSIVAIDLVGDDAGRTRPWSGRRTGFR